MFGMGTGGPSAVRSPTIYRVSSIFCISNELLYRFVAKQVSSPQQSLTSVFGMGTGGPSAVESLIVKITKLSFFDISNKVNDLSFRKPKLKLFP